MKKICVLFIFMPFMSFGMNSLNNDTINKKKVCNSSNWWSMRHRHISSSSVLHGVYCNLINANLHQADFSEQSWNTADLTGATGHFLKAIRTRFVNAILRRADFTGANFTGADLYGVDCTLTKFTGATLIRTEFVRADCKLAKFIGANMVNADLRGGNFYGADFTGANLTGVAFYGATVRGADFTGANLTGAVVSPSQAKYLTSQGISGFVILEETPYWRHKEESPPEKEFDTAR